jgi:hypothetical protein
MLTRTQLGIVVGACLLMVGSAAWALQAGGVEVGDLETGSVVGQPFKELEVDAQLFAIELGKLKSGPTGPPEGHEQFCCRAGISNDGRSECRLTVRAESRGRLEAGRNQVHRCPDQRPFLCHPREYPHLSRSSESEGTGWEARDDQVSQPFNALFGSGPST